jgi:outer membrane protein assembly factor BamB
MRRWLRLCAAALVVLAAGCQAISDGYHRVFGNPAPKPAELVAIAQPRAALRIAWQGSVGPAERNVYFPARSGTLVWTAGAAGGVTAFDMARGASTARIEAGERVSGGVGVGAGLVLLGTPRGEVLAFDPGGKLLWKAQLSSAVLAPPQAQEGIVVARAGDGHVYGLDAATGKQRWVYQRTPPALSVRTHAGVVIDRGGVFVGFPAGRLVALSLSNGNVGWEAVVALPRGATELERVADITSLPVMDGGRVCAAAFQGRVACLDAARGTMLWARDVSSVAGIGVDDRYLYVTDDKDAVAALDKASGASIWRQDRMARRSVSAPLPIGRYVAVGDLEGYVHLLSRDDGSFAARIATDGSPIVAPPVAIDMSTFLVQTRNGGVYAIAIE